MKDSRYDVCENSAEDSGVEGDDILDVDVEDTDNNGCYDDNSEKSGFG